MLVTIACWLLAFLSGCSSFAKRYHRDDVVLARQIARQGADAFHAGQWDRAAEYYSKAVEVCPVDERVRTGYAETMWNQGLHQEAIKHQQEAVRLSGGDPDLMTRLGEMYLARGELEDAERMVQRVIESGRESAATYRLRGDVYERQGEWREALAAYHRALSIQPNYPEVQFAVGRVQHLSGRPQRSLTTFQALAATYPPGEEPSGLHYWAGMAAASLGRHRKAVDYYLSAEAAGRRDADLYFRLAESQYRLGDLPAAEVALGQAMRIDPHHRQAAQLLSAIGNRARLARGVN